MRGIAAQEYAAVAKAIGEHLSPGPVLLPEGLKLEGVIDAEDFANATLALAGG
jgi:hypothetical protein